MKTPFMLTLAPLGCLAMIVVITFTGYGQFQREQLKKSSRDSLKDWTRQLGYRVDEWEGDARMKLAMASYLLTPEPSENQPAALASATNPLPSLASVETAEVLTRIRNASSNQPTPVSPMITTEASAPSLASATFGQLPRLSAGVIWSPVYCGMRSSRPAKSPSVISQMVRRICGH